MKAHTPGPWKVSYASSISSDIRSGDDWIASVYCNGNDSTKWEDEVQANARLIAAAPGLLAACIAAYPNIMCACDEMSSVCDCAVAQVGNIIDEATGYNLTTAIQRSMLTNMQARSLNE